MDSVPTTADPRQAKPTWADWVRAVAAVCAYGVWTLVPFELREPFFGSLLFVSPDDFFGNMLVAVPMGWLLATLVGPRRAMLGVVGLAVLVETAQLFLATRSPALADILANGLGAGGGVLWWSRRTPMELTHQSMLMLITLWGVASRYNAPGRPVVAAGILAALGVAALRGQRPPRWADVAGFALVGTGGVAGLSPPPLTVSILSGIAIGVLFAAPLRTLSRGLGIGAVVVLAVETWPVGRIAAHRDGDMALMVTELALFGLGAALYLIAPGGAPCTPAPSNE